MTASSGPRATTRAGLLNMTKPGGTSKRNPIPGWEKTRPARTPCVGVVSEQHAVDAGDVVAAPNSRLGHRRHLGEADGLFDARRGARVRGHDVETLGVIGTPFQLGLEGAVGLEFSQESDSGVGSKPSRDM